MLSHRPTLRVVLSGLLAAMGVGVGPLPAALAHGGEGDEATWMQVQRAAARGQGGPVLGPWAPRTRRPFGPAASPRPRPAPAASLSPSPKPTASPAPAPAPSLSPSPKPTASPRPTPAPSLSPSPKPTASPTPAPSPDALLPSDSPPNPELEATTALPVGVSAEELEELRRALGGDAAPSPPPVGALDAVQQNTNGGLGVGRFFQTMNPDISIITDVAAGAFTSDRPRQDGAHDPNRTGFTLQQVEMAIHSDVDPFFAYQANLVFGQFGVEVEEAYGLTTALPENLQLRAGQFLTRMGRLNTTHPHTWQFVDQPFFWSKVYGGEGNRGLGAELNWLAPLPWYVELAGSLTHAGGAATARSFYGATDLGVRRPQDLQATARLEQFFPLSRDWALNWGLSGATGPNPSGPDNRTDLLASDLYLRWRPLEDGSMQLVTWTTEGIVRRRQGPGVLLQDVGGYSSLFWRFAWQWGVAARAEWGQNLSNDPLDPQYVGDRQRYSTALTYWPTEFSRIRLQGSADLLPQTASAPVYGAILGIEFVTGAHGAHKF